MRGVHVRVGPHPALCPHENSVVCFDWFLWLNSYTPLRAMVWAIGFRIRLVRLAQIGRQGTVFATSFLFFCFPHFSYPPFSIYPTRPSPSFPCLAVHMRNVYLGRLVVHEIHVCLSTILYGPLVLFGMRSPRG